MSLMRGMFPDGVWLPWVRVMRADFAVPEFPVVWANARKFFSPQFAAFVDELLLEPRSLPAGEAQALDS